MGPLSSSDSWGKLVNALEEDLLMIRDELELREAGYEIEYATDFAELALYAFPFVHSLDPAGEGPHTLSERAVLTQVAVDYLLGSDSELPQVILVPPYVAELDRSSRIIARDFINYYAAAIREATAALKVKTKLLELRVGEELDQHLVLDYVRKNFKNVLGLLKLAASGDLGIPRLSQLLRSGRVIFSQEKWPALTGEPELSSKERRRLEMWLGSSRSERSYSNKMDAAAYAWIKHINNNLVSRRRIVVFITDTRILYDMLQKKPLEFWVTVDKKRLSLARLPQYVVTYLVHRHLEPGEPSNVRTLDQVKQSLQWIHEYRELDPQAAEMGQVLREIKKRMASIENLRLAATSDEYLAEVLERVQASEDEEVGCAREIVKYLQQENQRLVLIERINEALAEFQNALETLSVLLRVTVGKAEMILLPSFRSFMDTQSLGGRAGKDRLLYKIHFRQALSRQLAEGLHTARDSHSFFQVLSEVGRLRVSEEWNPEVHLLVAYLLARIDPYEHLSQALEEADSALASSKSEEKSEPQFMKAVLLRFKKEYPQALKLCREALDLKKEATGRLDARYLKEIGLVIWRWIDSKAEEEGVPLSSLLEDATARGAIERQIGYGVDDVIQYTLAAAENLDVDLDPYLPYQVYNNLALFFSVRFQEGDLEEALRYCDKLLDEAAGAEQERGLHPQSCLVIAFTRLKEARIHPEGSPERKRSKSDVLSYLNDTPLAKVTVRERNLIKYLRLHAKQLR